jgi:aryl-alcohol dehydrogenase (NADP+)
LGVNLIDTARAYRESEEIIGRALGAARSSTALMAKDAELPPEALRERVFASIRENLRLLRTDYFDIVLLHSRLSKRGDVQCIVARAVLCAKQQPRVAEPCTKL